MTETEQIIAIAQFDGWRLSDDKMSWVSPTGSRNARWKWIVDPETKADRWTEIPIGEVLPGYLSDMNAIQSAILKIPDDQDRDRDGFLWPKRCHFLKELEDIVFRDTGNTRREIQFELVNATARQRAEALLRAFGIYSLKAAAPPQ